MDPHRPWVCPSFNEEVSYNWVDISQQFDSCVKGNLSHLLIYFEQLSFIISLFRT